VIVCAMTEETSINGRVPVKLLSGQVINVKPGKLCSSRGDVFAEKLAVVQPTLLECDSKCWACGRPESGGIKFKKCSKCIEDNLRCCVFCSKECLAASWARHKSWHARQEAICARSTTVDDATLEADMKAWCSMAESEETGEMLSLAHHQIEQANYNMAIKLIKKVINVEPSNGHAHFKLANAYDGSNHVMQAATHALEALRLNPPERKSTSALYTVYAYNLLSQPECQSHPMMPAWFDDSAEMVRLSTAAILHLQETRYANLLPRAYEMLARGLQSIQPRTEDVQSKILESLESAARVEPDPDLRLVCLARAEACRAELAPVERNSD